MTTPALFLFDGGLPSHPRKYHKCSIVRWLDTDPNYCIVHFVESMSNDPGIEICHIDNLLPVEKFNFLG